MHEKHWKTAYGDLFFDSNSSIWVLKKDSRTITVIAWKGGPKGPMLELVLREKDRQVIFEILEKTFDKELFEPKIPNKAAEKVMKLCRIICSHSETSIFSCTKELLQQFPNEQFMAVHTYYGNGLFCGMKRTLLGKIKNLKFLPCRCMNNPGTRLDTLI